jgi:hypothetical protein
MVPMLKMTKVSQSPRRCGVGVELPLTFVNAECPLRSTCPDFLRLLGSEAPLEVVWYAMFVYKSKVLGSGRRIHTEDVT